MGILRSGYNIEGRLLITREEVRSHLFQAHHLVTPADSLPEAAGVCGFQNSPPGTWLCAAFNRLRSCSAWQLQQELDEGRGIMQAWSLRGAPWIFPLHDAAVYLDALCVEEGESWIYTNGLRYCQTVSYTHLTLPTILLV